MARYSEDTIRVLDSYIDNDCEAYGPWKVMNKLLDCGADRKVFYELGFDDYDIDVITREVD